MRQAIARVRFSDGVEGDVLHVSLGGDTMTVYFALARLDDGRLTTKKLEGAQDIRREPPPIGVKP